MVKTSLKFCRKKSRFISPGSRQDHFDKLARQLRQIVMRVRHTDPKIFGVPDDTRQCPFEVAGMDDVVADYGHGLLSPRAAETIAATVELRSPVTGQVTVTSGGVVSSAGI